MFQKRNSTENERIHDKVSINEESGQNERFYEFLDLMGADREKIERVIQVYPFKISKHFLSLIKEKGDPIWKQCIPDIEELYDANNRPDPLNEERDTRVEGLIHRYPDRLVLLISSTCAIYCRFCTRKRKVGRINQITMEQILLSIDYIRVHKEVRDVLLSGGDPLMRTNSDIDIILKELRSIPHVEIIRIGTRMPSVAPERITPELVNILKKYHPLYVNLHFEHPREINPASERALMLLADAGIPLGSQTVLLRGVNDNCEVMKELMHKLVKNRVRPYYLYFCDPVKGIEHFRTTLQKGFEIFRAIQGHTSGLCVPHLIIDSPGGGKVPVYPSEYLIDLDDEKAVISNYKGELYEYSNPKI